MFISYNRDDAAFIDVYRLGLLMTIQLDGAVAGLQRHIIHLVDQETAVRYQNPAQQIKHFRMSPMQTLRGIEPVDQYGCAATAFGGASGVYAPDDGFEELEML